MNDNSGLSVAELESTYNLLARAIDEVGPDTEALFLTKLVLMLANRVGDAQAVGEAIEIASRDL